MSEIEIKPVQIVTIKNKIALYKKEDLANSVELVNFEEFGYEIVTQKNLYNIGDKAVLILPDYCVSDIILFDSFIRPNGDESKSMLGKVGGKPRRIRAKKFTLSKEPNGDAVYSNGILLPINEICAHFPEFFNKDTSFEEILGITKWEEPEVVKNGMTVGARKPFPAGLYKTDEINIYSIYNKIEFPIVLVGCEKIDGSSITIGIKDNVPFICSRNVLKPFTYERCIGTRKRTILEYLMFWKKHDLRIYETVPNDDDTFIKIGKPYLNTLMSTNNNDIVLRGELNGEGLKGSGNRNNPATKEEPNIKFFGVDFIVNGIAKKLSHNLFQNITTGLNIPTVKQVFCKEFTSFDELINTCNEYFKNNLIEGIVVRTLDSDFSAKIMNLEYDSKK